MNDLIGIGLYTPIEAQRLTGIGASKVSRWLRGHSVRGQSYDRLWRSQVDLGDGKVYLGFRDLMEVRVVDALIRLGLSGQRVRRAIQLAQEIVGIERPLATNWFKTDGRSLFIQILHEDPDQDSVRLLDLFKKQYVLSEILKPVLKGIQFDQGGNPEIWWPLGYNGLIAVDPTRAFGQPIDAPTSVPSQVLAQAGKAFGVGQAAKLYDVPVSSIQRCMNYEERPNMRLAA